jgi:hypothetical protein
VTWLAKEGAHVYVLDVRASGAAGGRWHQAALIVNRSSLGYLLERRPRPMPASDDVVLTEPRLTATERDGWQSRLTVLYNDCGCEAGGVGLLAAVPVLVGLFLLGPSGVGPLEPRGLAMILGLPVMGAVGGKVTGLARRRRRLRAAIAELEALLDALARQEEEASG